MMPFRCPRPLHQGLWTGLVLLLTVSLSGGAPCRADESARQFLSGVAAYQQGDYQSAVRDFNDLVRAGVTNPKLFYDLGNAYLKLDDLGHALLWYERAQKDMPHDPDLRFNLEYARSLTKDARDTDGGHLLRILFFWRYQLSSQTIMIAALVCNLLFWLTAGAYRLTRRKYLKTAALVVLVPTIIFFATAAFNFYAASQLQQGIILPAQVSVRAGLDKSTTALFELHAGAKVTILKQMKDHCQIQYSEDKLGWVSREALGIL